MAGSQLCRGTLPLVQVVLGILLPTLVSIWAWIPDEASPPEEQARGLARRGLRQASQTCAAADRALKLAFQGRRSGMPHPLFISWWLLTCCWLWCTPFVL